MRKKSVPQITKAKKIFTTFEQYLQYEAFTLKGEEELIKNCSLETISMNQLISESDRIYQKQLQQLKLMDNQAEEEANQILLLIDSYKEASRIPKDKRQKMAQFLARNDESCRNISRQVERTSTQQTIEDLELDELQKSLSKIQQEKKEMKEKRLMKWQQEKTTGLQIDQLKKDFDKLEKEQELLFNQRKRYNAQLQELKGNIRVYCRIRPAHSKEIAIQPTSDTTLKLTLSKQNLKSESQKYEQAFAFDLIFGSSESQGSVFSETSQLILNAVDGNNVCIFAYGQTGSGKTYTLLGPDDEFIGQGEKRDHRGLTSRSIEVIFQEIYNNHARLKSTYRVFLSIQEIYLETIRDLITKEIVDINSYTENQVFSPQQIQTILKQAKMNRRIAATDCNERSSRSHLIVTIRIQGPNQKKGGSLVLVDLAGSERLKQSKAEGSVLKETQFINKSLSCLGNVINGLRNKSQHVPYRNSKLTHSLQPYLEGNSKMLMFVNVSPDEVDASQTKISLSFAESARETKTNNKK